MAGSDDNPAASIGRRLLRLSPVDNIYIATQDLRRGQQVRHDDVTVQMLDPIPVGHKIAACAISANGKIIKCGVPIGSATCNIAPGQHVHTHNLKSDYLPTFTLESGREFVQS